MVIFFFALQLLFKIDRYAFESEISKIFLIK